MKLPAFSRFLSTPRLAGLRAAWRLNGLDAVPLASPWSRTPVLIARSRCRLRWFRLQGLPAPERLSSLRLQVEAWRPFDRTDARLSVIGELGLAVAWDAAALEQDVLAAGWSMDRFQLTPETFAQQASANGLRLLQAVEGYEAQQWADGQLMASRWWPQALSDSDWEEFVRASGASRSDVALQRPEPECVNMDAPAWARSHSLRPAADQAGGGEGRLVLAGGVALALAAGVMVHQLWDAHAAERRLKTQIEGLRAAAGPVVAARDATLAQVADIEKLSNWLSVPQPVDVMGHLNDTLGRLGVQIKELELEGEKLRVAFQLGPNTGRADVVKDLQAGGWFTDVTEARADNSRNLLTMDMRIRGALPPVVGNASTSSSSLPPLASQSAALSVTAVAIPGAPAALAAVPRSVVPAAPAPSARAKGPPPPLNPITAKPDADGLPPPSVFDAIPSR